MCERHQACCQSAFRAPATCSRRLTQGVQAAASRAQQAQQWAGQPARKLPGQPPGQPCRQPDQQPPCQRLPGLESGVPGSPFSPAGMALTEQMSCHTAACLLYCMHFCCLLTCAYSAPVPATHRLWVVISPADLGHGSWRPTWKLPVATVASPAELRQCKATCSSVCHAGGAGGG